MNSKTIAVMLTGVTLLLAACGGGGGAPAPTSLSLANGETVDISSLTGAGTAADPYVIPANTTTGAPNAGLTDYLSADSNAHYWQLQYRSKQLHMAGTVNILGAMVYDASSDSWIVESALLGSAAVARTFSSDGAGGYSCTGCDMSLTFFDAATASTTGDDYGTFALAAYGDGSNATYTALHSGLATVADNKPTGTATYSGVFEGYVVSLRRGDASGTATMSVNFDNNTLDFSSTGIVAAAGGDMEYTISGTATISGSNFEGTSMTGIISDPSSTYAWGVGGSINGSFYGPAAEQAVGTLYAQSGGSDAIIGGFWTEKQP